MAVQSERQVAVFCGAQFAQGLPGSHSSTPACTSPSPHLASLQLTQLSVESAFPSSHCSASAKETMPSPHVCHLHPKVQRQSKPGAHIA